MNNLEKFLKAENAPDTSADGSNDTAERNNLEAKKATDASAAATIDISAELMDRNKRQMYMQKLVENGRAKIVETSKVTAAVGAIANGILKAKPIIDLVVKNTPQAAPAALPWAGVCIGLEVSSNPSITRFRAI